MKIVFLDANTLGEDIDYAPFQALGEVIKYPFSASEEVPRRSQDADVLVITRSRSMKKPSLWQII